MTSKQIIRSFRTHQLQGLFWGNGITRFVEYWENIKLKARRRLLVWSFQPVRQNLKNVPIFAPADLVRFPTGVLSHRHPGRYLRFLMNFWKYQKNIRGKSWSSLSMIYCRPLVIWYYYTLFWWAEYCGVLDKLLQDPGRSLIPELFIRYIIKIDSIIDIEGGGVYLLEGLPLIKKECADVLQELLIQIKANREDTHGKKLRQKIWGFRQNSLMVSRNTQGWPELKFQDMLDYKDKTAGELSRVWVDLLCDVYDVEVRVENSRRIFGLVSMAIQVVDDMLDSPVDFRDHVSNIFIHLLMETPGEFDTAKAHFEQFPGAYLDWVWANKYLPNACKKAVELITGYTREISTISENQIMTIELCEIMEDWRVLNP